MTNYEKIKSMTIEEMKEHLVGKLMFVIYVHISKLIA